MHDAAQKIGIRIAVDGNMINPSRVNTRFG
jgi:hypothetical protein